MRSRTDRLMNLIGGDVSGRSECLVVSVAFLVILTAVFWRVVFLGEVLTPVDLIYMHDPVWRQVAPVGFTFPSNPLLSDQVFQFYPWLVFARNSLRHGVIPLWNPFVLAGTQFLANQQSAVFYPLNLLLYFLPIPVGIGYLAITRLFIAGLSSYYYLRILGAGRTGAFIGACAFTFGGFSIVWLGSPISNVAILLPLVLLLTERLLRYGGYLNFSALALVIGAQFLGGHPETSFHVGLTWAACVTFRLLVMLHRGSALRVVFTRFVAASISFLIGFSIASVQVLPFLAVLAETSTFAARRGGPGGDWLFYPGFWRELITSLTVLSPNVLGNPIVSDAASWNIFSNFNEQAAFIGTVPLLLAIVGATMWRRNSLIAFWLSMALVSAGIAYRLPGFELVNHMPIFNIAANGRLRLTIVLAAAVLCAFGTDLLIQRIDDGQFIQKIKRGLGLSTLVVAIGTLAGFAVLALWRDWFLSYGKEYIAANVYGKPGFPESLDYYLAKLPAMYDALLQYYSPATLRVYLPILFLASLWIVLSTLPGRDIDRVRLKTSLVLLTVIDLAVLAYGYNPSIQTSELYPTTKAIDFLRERTGDARIAGIGFALTPNASMLWHLRDVRGYEMTVDRRFQVFYDSFVTKVPFGMYNLLAKPSPKLFELLGVKYVIARPGAIDPQFGFPLKLAANGVNVYENPDALPRAFIVGRGRLLPDDKSVLQTMHSASFKPLEEVLLESTAPSYEPTKVSGNVEVRDPNVNEVDVHVSTDAPAWLVLSDTYDGGWKAFVDGSETKVYRANYVMRAVRVDAGSHTVQFKYDPPAFEIGLRVSITALLLTAMIALFPVVRRRMSLSQFCPSYSKVVKYSDSTEERYLDAK